MGMIGVANLMYPCFFISIIRSVSTWKRWAGLASKVKV